MQWNTFRLRPVSPEDLLRQVEVFAPPIPVSHLVRQMGIHLHFVADPGWDGACRVVNPPDIWIRQDLNHCERRYMTALQLGHVLHGKTGSEYRTLLSPQSPFERFCAKFAIALLMPRAWVLEKIYQTWDSLDELADLFQVPPVMAIERIDQVRQGKPDF